MVYSSKEFSTKGALCPHCFYLNKADNDIKLYDTDTKIYTCKHCNKVFSVEVNISYDWWTEKLR